MKAGNYPIPFDKNGNQLHYPDTWGVHAVASWQDNADFQDALTFVGYSRGRSAAYFHFRRNNGLTVTVFLTEFEDMVPRMVNGTVVGTFRFIKRGQNYGCGLVST